MLTVKKILAGRGAVDYYLNQARRGLADYYLPDERAGDGDGAARLAAPGSSWWGGGVEALDLSGEVSRDEFVPLYTKAARPDGGYLGRRFRLPEEAAFAKADALRAASEITDAYERWMAHHEIRRRAPHASVAAWDCTFSPPKSVSLLWAAGDRDVQRQVWAAHLTAVDAGLDYLQEHAAYVRAGRNGVRVLDTTGLVVARMNEWTSRDGDMHLHTHCLVLNRAHTLTDGKWRALDGRALLSARTGAGALYNRTLETELTRRLGVGWRDRPDGLRDLAGVDDELIAAFSSRRRAITATVEQLAAAYRDKYGVDAPAAVLAAMGQSAWAATRRRKRDLAPAEALEQWEVTARADGRQLARLPEKVLGRRPAPRDSEDWDTVMTRLLAQLAASGQPTFTRHDLLRAALDVLTPGDLPPAELRARAQPLVDWAVSRPELVGMTAPEVLDTSAALRRRDGTSVYEQPDRQRWALKATLDQEGWLIDKAGEPTGRTPTRDVVEEAIVDHDLGADQAAAVRELLGCPQRIGLLVGPAGAGKTRTLRAVVAAWQHDGGDVLGLTVSQAAAGVLADEAHVRAENVAKWLHETRRGHWRLPAEALVLVDEASMVATGDLVEAPARPSPPAQIWLPYATAAPSWSKPRDQSGLQRWPAAVCNPRSAGRALRTRGSGSRRIRTATSTTSSIRRRPHTGKLRSFWRMSRITMAPTMLYSSALVLPVSGSVASTTSLSEPLATRAPSTSSQLSTRTSNPRRSSLVSAMTVNPDVVEKDLARLRRQMEAGRSGWVVEEGCGRCLRALGREDEAKRHLRRSLDRPEPEEHWQWLALGAIYRMLGEDAQAQECWGRTVAAIDADGRPEIDRGRLVEALFLSRRDDEALELARALDSNSFTRAAGVRMLAQARQAGDPELAQQAASWFADRISREREKVSATGMVSLHDWHEIATELAEELSSSA